MRFGASAALWLLVLLPLIALLYMLRARRQEVVMSSVLLWQRARRELASQLPIRRLERNLLLLLQLLVALFAILALAQPQVMLSTAPGDAMVIVLDTSASMQATDVAPSRFEVARQQALDGVAAAGGPVMVIAAGPQTRIATPFGDRAIARAVLSRLQPTDGPAHLDQAVALAVGQRVPQGRPQVVVFTDHVATPIDGVSYRVIGTSSRNLAIVGMHAERTPDGTHVVIQVRNASTTPERVPVTVALGERRLLRQTVLIAPGGTASVAVPVRGQGIVRTELEISDALAVDNTAYAVVGIPPPRVLIIGTRNRALDEALAALAVRFTPVRRVTAEALLAADVVILNRTPAVDLPSGNYLLLGTTAGNLPLTADGVVRSPQFLRWSQRHPVMRYVDLTGVEIGEALALRPRGGEVLAEGEVPLIWSYEGEGVRAIVVAFALEQSDFPLRVAFPIFLSNAIGWLGGIDQTYRAGQPLIVPAHLPRQAVLTDPTGTRTVLEPSGGRFVVPSLDRVGVYTLQVGEQTRRFAVNPAPEEAEIAPSGPPAGEAPAARTSTRQVRLYDAWPVLLGLALAVLAMEWVVWLRSLPRADLHRGQAVVRR